MEAYTPEFRGAVQVAGDAGEGTRAVALRFGVSQSWVRLNRQQRREAGQVAPNSATPVRPSEVPGPSGYWRRSPRVPMFTCVNFRSRLSATVGGGICRTGP
jgi:transposase-like protein